MGLPGLMNQPTLIARDPGAHRSHLPGSGGFHGDKPGEKKTVLKRTFLRTAQRCSLKIHGLIQWTCGGFRRMVGFPPKSSMD